MDEYAMLFKEVDETYTTTESSDGKYKRDGCSFYLGGGVVGLGLDWGRRKLGGGFERWRGNKKREEEKRRKRKSDKRVK